MSTSAHTQPLDLIACDMQAVDQVIADKLDSSVPLVSQVCRYIISAGGKRLRPALLLLMSGALHVSSSDKHTLAAVIEFIHTATLLHDDVVDESTLRRGRDTANQRFGNPASVLVGDFLYSRAFQMMVGVGNMRVMDVLAETTNVIAEGEVLQLMNIRDASLSEEGYLQVIQSKTAKLFEASARLAAIIANASPSVENACARYGQHLGTAFQVIDDVLDYEGQASLMGKNLGDDLREGKVTLPLIHALKHLPEPEKAWLIQAIEQPEQADMQKVLQLIHQTDAIAATQRAAKQQAQYAIEQLDALAPSVYKEALTSLASALQNRQS